LTLDDQLGCPRGLLAPRLFTSAPLRRRGRVFRLIARVLVAAFLAQVLPATAFADLSVPIRIPIAEWRKAMRKEMAVEVVCVMRLKPGEVPTPRRAPERRGRRSVVAGSLQLRVSMAAPRTRREAEAQGYVCYEVRRGRNLRVSGIPNAVTRRGLADGREVSATPSGLDAAGKARIPIEEWRDAPRSTAPQELFSGRPIGTRSESPVRRSFREVKERKAHDGALLDPGSILRHESIASTMEGGGGMDCVRHLDVIVGDNLGREFEDFVGNSQEDDAVVTEEILELLNSGDVSKPNRFDEALGTSQTRGEDGSAWSEFRSFNPPKGDRLFSRIAFYTTSQDAGIEVEPHRSQSRRSRISASISSPVISPGGKDRTYAASDPLGAVGGVYTITSTRSARGGRGASRWMAPSSMWAGMGCASISGLLRDDTTATPSRRKTGLARYFVVEVPTPNPSHVADGQQGRGSCHVVGAPHRNGLGREVRITAEVERMPSSPSAPSGFRSLGGNVQLNVAAGSLDEDTAIALSAYDDYSPFIPTTNGITPLGEVTVDFSSSVLNTSASLIFNDVAAAPGETLVVARVDRAAYDGFPRLQVVALADVLTANGETRAVSRADTGLPGVTLEGIRKEGRYTLLRLSGPVGFITGVTTAGGSPVRALVTTNTLPFVATSATAGYYAIPGVPGSTTVTARVLGQSLVGTAQATAIDGTPVTADIALQGTVSQAAITPASGSIGIEVNELLTLTSPVALDPTTVTAANIVLRTVPAPPSTTSTTVPLRFVLSGSGKQLSIIPTAATTTPPTPALAFSTSYALEVTGLLDTVGGLVTAPTTTFRTKDDIKPVYNLKALTFSFPDADGLVTVSAPNGTFPPGTEILIINGGNGVVLGLTAGNEGQVNGQIPASLSDTLLITVTDPFGNTTTFQSSKFVNPATGETAVGPGGGTIEGPDGTALDIPNGALSEAIALKLEVLTPEQYDTQFPNQRPAFGNRPIGSVLKISAAQPGTFNKPVKLIFNVPGNFGTTHPDADPRDAVFYTLKRSVLPSGVTGFEVVDHAFAVCPGDAPGGDLPARDDPENPTCDLSELKVKTASPPLPEFSGSVVGDTYIILTYDWSGTAALARSALAGAVVGRVRRQAWGSDAQAGELRYEPVVGAKVFGSDAGGNPLQSANALFTTSQKDGIYTLWDDAYTGGTVTIHADDGTETKSGVGYEGNPQDTSASWGPFQSLRFYQNKAHVDILFEAQQPPPQAPDVDILVLRETDQVDTRGLSAVGTPLRIKFRNNRQGETITIGSLDINGENFTVVSDPSGTFAGITQDTWTPSQSGAYVLQTTALSPLTGSIPVSTTVRIVAAGGGVDTDETQAPRVIEQQTYPKQGARNVQTSIFPTIAFTEPVVGITHSTVLLTRTERGPAGPIPSTTAPEAFKISGVSATGQVIDDVTQAPSLPITAITIQPLHGLKYKHTYVLSLSDGIQDLDSAAGVPSPKSLVPYTTTFDTFGPESIPPEGAPQSYTTTGFYVAKDEAGEPLSMWSLKHQIAGSNWFALLTGYDLSDPINVVETTTTHIFGRPMDVAGEGTLIAVATAPGVKSLPSNVRLYDVTNPEAPEWVGAASLTNSVGEGSINRITMRGSRVYAGTFKRGIQIVEVESMRSALPACCSAEYFKASSDLNLDGKGFNQAAIIATIPVPGPSGQASFFSGIKSLAQSAEPLIVATGNFGLALARESSAGSTVYRGMPSKDGETLQYGLALDVANVGGYDLAVVAGVSGTKQILMVVDVSNPLLPVALSVREIVADGRGVVDVLVNGTLVYVSTQKATAPPSLGVEVFDISDPDTIAHLGRIDGVGGRLSIVGKLLYGATSGTFGAPIDGAGGVRSAALGTLALIEGTNPPVVVVGEGPRAAEDFQIRYRVFPPETVVASAKIEYRHGDSTVGEPVNVTLRPDGRGELPLLLGFTFPKVSQNIARPRLIVTTAEGEEITGPAKAWRHEQPTVELVFDDDQEEAVTADRPEVTVEVVSPEWARRAEEAAEKGEPAPPSKAVSFEAILPPATMTQPVHLANDGFFESKLQTSTQPGQNRFVRAKVGDVLLGESDSIEIEAGQTAEPTSALTPLPTAIPADDLSETLITLVAKDQYGNPVADGTAVVWEKGEGADGEFVEAQEGTTAGQATVKYRAGVNPGPVTINAHVDDILLTTTVQQAVLARIIHESRWLCRRSLFWAG